MTNWEKLEDYFSKKSMMEILGVDRDENAHSKFLGWLFENEDTREVAIKSLLVLLKDKKEQEQNNAHFPTSIKWDTFSIKDAKVTLEDFVEYSGFYGRADIVIDVTDCQDQHIYIIIENKIDSFEHKMGKGQKQLDALGDLWQTEGYFNYYKEKYGEENCVFVFLTRHKSQIEIPKKIKDLYKPDHEDGRAQSDSFIWINYQDVLDSILVEVRGDLNKKMKETESGIERDAYLSELLIRIEDYIRCLGINKNQDNLMAVSKDLEAKAWAVWNENNERLKNIRKEENWEKNKDFIQPLFKVLSYLCEKDIKEEKQQIEDINKVVNGKDYTTYVIKREGKEISVKYGNKKVGTPELGKNGMVKTVVWLYIHENKLICENQQQKIDLLQKAFPIWLRVKGRRFDENAASNKVVDGSCHNDWKVVNDISVSIDGKNLPTIEANNIYVNQTGWDGKPMMRKFIEHAHKLLGKEYLIEEVAPNEETKINDD